MSLWANIYEVKLSRNDRTSSKLTRCLNERTFMSEPIENHAISKLSNVPLNNHQCKHRRRFRCDLEPSRIPMMIRSFKRPRNKNKKVREFVYTRILHVYPCHLQCTVMWKLESNCCGRIRQSIKKINIELIDICHFFCNKLMCPCKSETHVAN